MDTIAIDSIMNVYIVIALLACLLALLQSIGLWKSGLFAGFLVTIIFYALHYDFGNDYMSYYDWFLSLYHTPFPSTYDEFKEWSRDPGWDLINWCFGVLFGENGFFYLVALFAVIQGYAYYGLIRKYVPEKWYWLSMAIYVFSSPLYLQSFNVMRMAFVMAIFVRLVPRLQSKEFFRPIIVLLLCTFIHASSVILFIVVVFSIIPLRPQIIAITSVMGLLLLLFSTSLVDKMIDIFPTLTSLERFAVYIGDDGNHSFGFGYILKLIPFYIVVVKMMKDEVDSKYHFVISIWLLGVVLQPLSQVSMIIDRITYYFETMSVVVLPIIYATVKNKPLQMSFVMIWFIFAVATIYHYMSPESVFYEPYRHYQTIFSIK